MKTFRDFVETPEIVTATVEDLTSISILESDQTYETWTENTLRNALSHPRYETRMLKAPGPVGFYITRTEAGLSELNKLVVLESARGRGYGELMLQDWMDRQPTMTLKLQVEADNVPAQGLYRKMGFQKTQVLEKYYANGGDAVEMTRV